MRLHSHILLGIAVLATPALAKTVPEKDNQAVKSAHTVNDGAAERGANSFTQDQAREHIAKSGFTRVSRLLKDSHGVWRGTARKGDHTVNIGLDFKGNVSLYK